MSDPHDLRELEKDPRLFLYTSLTAGSSHIITATSRLETILKANRVPFQAVDVATDEKARRLWQRRAGKRKLPGLVKDGFVLGDLEEVEEWNEYGELKENIGTVPSVSGSVPAPKLPIVPTATAGTTKVTAPNPLLDMPKKVALPGAAEIAARNNPLPKSSPEDAVKPETMTSAPVEKEKGIERAITFKGEEKHIEHLSAPPSAIPSAPATPDTKAAQVDASSAPSKETTDLSKEEESSYTVAGAERPVDHTGKPKEKTTEPADVTASKEPENSGGKVTETAEIEELKASNSADEPTTIDQSSDVADKPSTDDQATDVGKKAVDETETPTNLKQPKPATSTSERAIEGEKSAQEAATVGVEGDATTSAKPTGDASEASEEKSPSAEKLDKAAAAVQIEKKAEQSASTIDNADDETADSKPAATEDVSASNDTDPPVDLDAKKSAIVVPVTAVSKADTTSEHPVKASDVAESAKPSADKPASEKLKESITVPAESSETAEAQKPLPDKSTAPEVSDKESEEDGVKTMPKPTDQHADDGNIKTQKQATADPKSATESVED